MTNKGDLTKSGVYFLKNKINRRFYIGSAINCARRKIEHKKLLQSGKHVNVFLLRDFKKYNKSFDEVFSFEIKEFVLDADFLLQREQVYLDRFFDNQKKCYNLAPKAGSALGVKWSNSAKEKHSQKRTGEGNPMWGKFHSEQTRLLMSKQQLKEVLQFTLDGDLVNKFNSIAEAAKAAGVSRQMIGHCCNRNRKTSKGFVWRFKDEKEKR